MNNFTKEELSQAKKDMFGFKGVNMAGLGKGNEIVVSFRTKEDMDAFTITEWKGIPVRKSGHYGEIIPYGLD